MKVIKMILGGTTLAEITDGEFTMVNIEPHIHAPNLAAWFDACFYSIPNSNNFEKRFALVESGVYFCYEKPNLRLIAEKENYTE